MAGQSPNRPRTGNGSRNSGSRTGGNNRQQPRVNGSRNGNYGKSRSTASRGNANVQRRSQQTRRRRVRHRPVYTRLWFWVVALLVVIVAVLLTKGCDTGTIDAGGTAQTPALPTTTAPGSSGMQGATGGSAGTTPTGSTSGNGGTMIPTTSTYLPPATSGTTLPTGNQNGGGATAPVGTTYLENHHVGAGTQLIGADLPAGTVDITVLSGTGSVVTSDRTLNYPAFGEGYTTTLSGIVLNSGVSITVTGNLSMKFSYLTEPVIDRPSGSLSETVYTFMGGDGTTYTVGEAGDIPAGTYEVSSVDGYGEVVTSDAAQGGGIDAMMGTGGNYTQTVKNVVLNEGVTITVRNCTVRFTRVIISEE